ncbi:MAG: hypothetical protein ACOC9Y_04505, partial [Chloroflexota bacterium]
MGIANFLLAIGLSTIAVLGPLGFGAIQWRISENMERQLLAIDAVALFVVAPVAAVAGVLWLRGQRIAPVVAMGPAVYAVYFLFQDILTPEYLRYEGNNEQYFPLVYAVLLLGVIVAVAAWSSIDASTVPEPGRRLRLLAAWLFIGFGMLLALGWAAWIAEIIQGNIDQVEYQEHPAGSWLVKTMDLVFLVPAAIATGIGLLRRSRVAFKAAMALAGVLTYLAAAVAGMALVMVVQDDPSAQPAFVAVTVPATLALA